MLKYLGAFAVTLAATLFGLEKCSSAKKELSSLAELYDFFVLLSRRIRERKQALSEICLESTNAFAKKLSEAELEWSTALERLRLSDDVKEKILQISESLGGVSAKNELELCSDAEEFLSQRLESSKKELDGKLPLYRSLWLIAGLSAVIILM